MHPDIQKILYTEAEITIKVDEIGKQITQDYTGEEVVLLGILKGSVVFMSDLMRRIDLPLSIDFMSISSYGNESKSTGVVKILKDLDRDIEDEHVIVVEDVVDSGQTLVFLRDILMRRNPKSLKICTFLDKPTCRDAGVIIKPDYCGFDAPDEFLVGYGLDYAQRYRGLPYVGVLKPEQYQ